MLENLIWRAVYNDGSSLLQVEDGKVHKYTEIDRVKLTFFDLINPETGDILYRLHIDDPRKRLIYRLRTKMKPGAGVTGRIILLGWQMRHHGENIQSVIYITEDEGVIMSGAWDKLPAPYHAPELYDQEK